MFEVPRSLERERLRLLPEVSEETEEEEEEEEEEEVEQLLAPPFRDVIVRVFGGTRDSGDVAVSPPVRTAPKLGGASLQLSGNAGPPGSDVIISAAHRGKRSGNRGKVP